MSYPKGAITNDGNIKCVFAKENDEASYDSTECLRETAAQAILLNLGHFRAWLDDQACYEKIHCPGDINSQDSERILSSSRLEESDDDDDCYCDCNGSSYPQTSVSALIKERVQLVMLQVTPE